jgi:FtsH-binding integral membrane protein
LKVGFGLWNYRGLEFGLEIAILVVGIVLYLKRNAINSVAGKVGIVAFGVVLILIQAGNTFVRRPPSSDRAFAITALIFYTVFAAIAFLLEKRRVPDRLKKQ